MTPAGPPPSTSSGSPDDETHPGAVLVVGGSGLVGTALSHRLSAVPFAVVNADVCDNPRGRGQWQRFDLLRDDIDALLERARPRAVVHLAARVDPPNRRERALMRRLHVDGTKRLVEAMARAGVPQLVLCSSSVVYGARPDNPVPLREDDPVRPNPDFPYAVDKAEQERIAMSLAPSAIVTVVRPAVIYGPSAFNYLTEFLRRAPGILPALDGRRPPLDFVWVDDVAEAIARAIERRAGGVFNLASRAPATYEQVAEVAGLNVVDIPRRLVEPALNLGARFAPSWLRAPSYVLDQLAYPFVTSGEKAERELGFLAQRTALQALRGMLDGT